MRHLVQHITDPAGVDDVGRRNLMLKLPGPMTQPNINSFFESELGFAWIVVLNDTFGQDRLLMWLGRRESASVGGPRKAEPPSQSVLGFSMFAICDMQITADIERRMGREFKGTALRFPGFARKFFTLRVHNT